MADVTNKVATIRNAVYGNEVREGIASGIENINTEVISTTGKQEVLETVFNGLVINAGSDNAEIVVARGIEDSLPIRLNKFDLSLAHKANNSEVRKTATKLELEDASATFLGAIAGTGTFNLLSIPQDLSVTPEKTSFIKTSTNLFNKYKLTTGYSVNPDDGTLIANVSTSASELYPVIGGESIAINVGGGRFAFYLSLTEFQTGSSNAMTAAGATIMTVPINAKYVRIAIPIGNVDIAQFNKGNTLLPYESYYKRVDDTISTSLPKTNTIMTYDVKGNLTKAVEMVGLATVKTTTLSYDNANNLLSTVETKNDETIQTTLNYTNNVLTSVSKIIL